MLSGLIALVFAAAFAGAAVYVIWVEQPARLALDEEALLSEWTPSDRRGVALLAAFALAASIAGFIAYFESEDVRWVFGALIIISSWPYAFFVIVPVNVWLYTLPPERARSDVQELMREWGLLEWGQTVIGLVACWFLAWVVIQPA